MSTEERICKACGANEDTLRLEKCGVCSKFFCHDCGHRAFGGRKFCSEECARGFYFHGEVDDDEEQPDDDD